MPNFIKNRQATLAQRRMAKVYGADAKGDDDPINLEAYEQLVNFLREKLQPNDLAHAEGMIEHLFNVQENVEAANEREEQFGAMDSSFLTVFPDAARLNRR